MGIWWELGWDLPSRFDWTRKGRGGVDLCRRTERERGERGRGGVNHRRHRTERKRGERGHDDVNLCCLRIEREGESYPRSQVLSLLFKSQTLSKRGEMKAGYLDIDFSGKRIEKWWDELYLINIISYYELNKLVIRLVWLDILILI